ncbi:hypothetical protein [Sphingomonas faeni]|uniref:hypothetical protein n=1 Tax=Sphingomonas faeni TaxID=185950 RepID=UPI0027D9149F|nr:hypothetical protein [Sphingomonas faeni]
MRQRLQDIVNVNPSRHEHPPVRSSPVHHHHSVLRTHPEALHLNDAAVRLATLFHPQRLTQQFDQRRPPLIAEPATELLRTLAANQNATLPATGEYPDHAGFQVR